MEMFTTNGYYEVHYQNNQFTHMELIRLDTICKVRYLTFKNVLTGEMITFELSGINLMRKIKEVLGS